jgi:predicted ATP-grasp superfamily ATP-dependent carboligase
VLVAGVSTRAIAESTARAGFAVTAIDAFADLDQHPSVDARSLGPRFSPEAAARAAAEISCDAVAYTANFENDPAAVDRFAHGRALWGNPADVIRRVRDPRLLSEAVQRRGLAAASVWPPATDHRSSQSKIPNPQAPPRWLLKRYASGGGHGVREWRDGTRVPAGAYLQEFLDGAPASVVFVAANRRAIPIGLTRQLVGDRSFGVSGYRYCGNILTAAGEDDQVLDAAGAVADVVCDEFGLIGVNGVDLIVVDNIPYAIEVNPRWCASMELVERAYGLSVFGVHASACRDGVLPDFDLAKARGSSQAIGKAVVFARHDVTIRDTASWLAKGDAHMLEIRDVPRPGMHVRAGQPLCTVFATGRDSRACREELVSRAERVYGAVAAML